MLRNKYSSAITTLLAVTVVVPAAACESDDVPARPEADEVDEQLRAGPRPSGDDLGPRSFGTVPNYRAAICPKGTSCMTIDVNDDGKQDLVRFDQSGILGESGTVSVALSNGWNFGPMVEQIQGFCKQGDSCLAADITGDSLPDLVRFVPGQVTELWVVESIPDGFEDPKLWAEGFCGPNQACMAGDVTGDGIADLVAFARFADQSGGVRVYRGGQGPGLQPELWGQGFCTDEKALCRLGDVDGDGIADVVQFGREQGFAKTLVARSTGSSLEPLESWAGGDPICPAGAECQLGDFNGDWAADVIATFPEPTPQSDPSSCSGTCGAFAGSCWCDDACVNYGDCCSDYQAICVSGNTCEGSCGGSAGGCWCDEACTSYGDCCSDFPLQCGGSGAEGEIQLWLSSFDSFDLVYSLLDMPCDPGELCWTADITGDGRQDLITIDVDGLLELFPSRDRVDRMLDAAVRLSMLYTDFERRRQRWAAQRRSNLLRELVPVSPELAAALPDRFPTPAPPPPPTPSPSEPALPVDPLPDLEPWPGFAPGALDQHWIQGELEELSDVIALESAVLLDSIPNEGTLVESSEQQRWQELIGHVIAARTALYSPALAAGPVSERRGCTNAILHDRFVGEDGITRVEGSYLSRFHDALREHDPNDRIWAALPALTGVVEGLRCMSETEMAGLEAAYVEAVTATMQDLLDRGQPALAQVAWDQALPIELILFDAVKSFTKPQGWRLLQARIEAGEVVVPEFPPDGSDFDQFYVEDNTTCSTLRCQLYKGPHRTTTIGANLILDTLGAWLPDLSARERLRRSSLYPETLLDAMVNFEVLGEGDCALVELSFFNPTCKSRRTCEFAEELAQMPNELGLDLLAGQPGSPLTHLGTERAELDTRNGCGGSGGGAAPSGCFGPELRGHRGRFFPLDPELDRVMSCTFEVFDGSEPTLTAVEMDLDFDPACLLQDPPDAGVPPPPAGTPEPQTVDYENIQTARDEVADVLRGDREVHGRARQEFIDALIASGFALPTTSEGDIIAIMNEVAGLMGTGTGTSLLLRLAQPRAGVPDSPLYTLGFRSPDGSVENFALEIDAAEFNDDLAHIAETVDPSMVDQVSAEYMFVGFMHEAMHMVMHLMSARGYAAPEVTAHPLHHTITHRLGLDRVYARSCDPGSTACRSTCGFGDNRVQRFTECVSGGGSTTPIDRCAIAEDYCTERAEGSLWFHAGVACGAPGIDYPPLCAAVTCDGSSDLASACCGGGGSGGGSPPPFPWSVNPGPHPGDPDGPYPGIPGGPGGVPFPPIPPIF